MYRYIVAYSCIYFCFKTSTSALLTMPKSLTVWITTNCRKFFKRWEYQTTLPASWEICIQVKKQQLKLDMEQQTGSKSGKEYFKDVDCHPAHLIYMQNALCKMPGWMKHKLESRLNLVVLNRAWCFWTVVLQKILESPLDCKEIQPVHPKGNQSWIFIGRTDAEAEAPIFWPPDAKNWLTG